MSDPTKPTTETLAAMLGRAKSTGRCMVEKSDLERLHWLITQLGHAADSWCADESVANAARLSGAVDALVLNEIRDLKEDRSLSSLIRQAGDDHVEFQILAESLLRFQARKRDAELTFATALDRGQDLAVRGTDAGHLALVVWIPKERLPERLR